MWHGTIGEFCDLAEARTVRAVIIRSCRDVLTGHEKKDGSAWEQALYAFADALRDRELDDRKLFVEARMPNNNARADFVILGTNPQGGRGAVVIELKMWSSCRANRLGRVTLRSETDSDRDHLHPCWQVLGYRDQLKLYSAALVNREPKSEITGFAFLPCISDTSVLTTGDSDLARRRNQVVADLCPCFGANDYDSLSSHIRDLLPEAPEHEFVNEFCEGKRAADESLQEMAEKLLLHWPLIDEQLVVALKVEELIHAMRSESNEPHRRRVVIITGGPGSGKTVLAVWILLSAIARNHLLNSVFVTTSKAHEEAVAGEMQLQDLGHLLPAGMQCDLPVYSARDRAMKFITPGFQTKRGADDSGAFDTNDPDWWKNYCRTWPERLSIAANPEYQVLVCDEAQALVNVERDEPYARVAGWVFSSGPQAAHLINKAAFSVFLMDGEQGYRDAESTTREDILKFARQMGVNETDIHHLHLEGLQFRLAGNEWYLEWLDWLLCIVDIKPTPPGSLVEAEHLFKVYDCPSAMRNDLRLLHDEKSSPCRLLAAYGWEWVSKNDSKLVDSVDGLGIDGRKPPPGIRFRWLYPEDRQRAFNLGQPPFDDPDNLFGVEEDIVAHVGYPLVVRGRDFEHVGVMWPSNLIHRDDKWKVDLRLVFGTDHRSTIAAINRDPDPESAARRNLAVALSRGLRILLTRGVQTVSVWIEDKETRDYVREQWQSFISDSQNAQSDTTSG